MKGCCEVDRILCIRLHFRSDVTSNPAATFSLFCHSFQLDLCHCHISHAEAPTCARGSLMRLGISLLRQSIEPEPSDSPPHTFVTSPRAPAVANWHLGDLAISHPLSFCLRERQKGPLLSRPVRPRSFFPRFAKLFYSWSLYAVWGEKLGACNTSMLRPVYSSLSRRTAGIGPS